MEILALTWRHESYTKARIDFIGARSRHPEGHVSINRRDCFALSSLHRPRLVLSLHLECGKPHFSKSRLLPSSAILEQHQILDGCLSSTRILPPGLEKAVIPEHVAIIMDGNSRWAKEKGVSRELGHEAGVRSLREVVRLSGEWGVKALTVFAFSTENWRRPEEEVGFLMQLFGRVLKSQIASLHRENVRVRFIGDLSRTPSSLQQHFAHAELKTSGNTGLLLNVALSYSGRQDVVQACQAIARRVQEGHLEAHEIREEDIERELCTSSMGSLASPDLLIRTSGEHRLSNFMLWQTAYSELHFSKVYWPDFRESHFKEAILEFQQRNRRFGGRCTPTSPPQLTASQQETLGI